MAKIGRASGEAVRFEEIEIHHGQDPSMEARRRGNVVSQIVEKLLVNLRVLSQLDEGDKLDYTASGHFLPQKPGRWTWALRVVKRLNRWDTLAKVHDVVATAEAMEFHNNGEDRVRIQTALRGSIHGLRNLQATYREDTLFFQSIEVLLERIGQRYGLHLEEML